MKNIIPLKYRLFKKYNGCVPNPIDERDIKLSDVLGAGAYVPDPNAPSWEQGFDNEVKWGKLKREHQGNSLSCVGQGWSKYLEMLDKIEQSKDGHPNEFADLSARFVYSQIYLPNDGAYIRDGAGIAVHQGCAKESVISSYENNGNPPSETFMRNNNDITDQIKSSSLIYQSKKYVYLETNKNGLTNEDWENIRQVIYQFGGFVSGYNRHCMYASAYKLINGKRSIHFINSYGDGTDHEYVEGSSYPIYDITFLIDLPNSPNQNNNNMLKIVGNRMDQKQYILGSDGKLRHIFNPTILEDLHAAGVVDKNAVEWRDHLEGLEIVKPWAVIA